MKYLKCTSIGMCLGILSLLCCNTLFAQRFAVELQGMMGKSSIIDNKFEPNQNLSQQKFKPLPSNAFGIGFNWYFSKHLSGSIGFQRSSEAANRKRVYHYEDPNVGMRTAQQNIDFFYVYNRIPLNINYHFRNPENKLRPILGIGLNYGWEKKYYYNEMYNNDADAKHLVYYYYSPGIEFGITGFAGLEYKFCKNFSLKVGLNGYRGIINIERNDIFAHKGEINNINLRGMFAVAYSF